MTSKTFTSDGSIRVQKKPMRSILGCALALSLGATVDAYCAAHSQGINIDSPLQKLYTQAKKSMPATTAVGVHAQIAVLTSAQKQTTPGRFDATSRVLVHVLLDGTSTPASVSQQITTLKGSILDINTDYRHGVLAVYLPTDQIENCSAISGVRALTMEFPPKARVGLYTSQGATVLGTKAVNQAGLKGDGITVGVLSDSFNTAYQVTSSPPVTTAPQDVATGDLPVVKVLQDYPMGADEGRAMCQIVYDEAPHCKLAFATADQSEVGFANNIVLLRTKAKADVIVDDFGYFDEPVFSDGMVALAVDTVATSKTLPGNPVVYCSAAGNDGNNGYRNYYRNLTDAKVRQAGHHGNLQLNVTDPTAANYLDPSLTAGGWYNWNPNGGSEPVTTVSAPGPTSYPYAIFLQWDDLFDQDHGITTSYNFLVFDADGNYLPDLSSTTNAFAVQQPFQGIGYLNLGTNYQIAITKTTQTDPQAGPIPFTHQLALYTTLDGASNLQGKYFHPAPLDVPNIFGHPQADGAIAVAAYAFSWTPGQPYAPELENFTSPGPSTIYFDQNSNRLPTPIVRLKPEVAGVDGVLTTFFGAPYYNYPFAFFGTSAAAPSVAGVAALMVQGAGGSGSLDPGVAKQDLEESAVPRNSSVETTQALGANSAGYVAVTALGQSYFGPNYLTVNYIGGPGHSITELTINGGPAGLVFNTTEFALGTLSGIRASDVTVESPSTSTSKFTLKFKSGVLTSGVSFGFTVGQDVGGSYSGFTQDEFGAGVEAEDLAYGATFTAKFASSKDSNLTEPFEEGYETTGYSQPDGYGLVSAPVAVGAVLPINSSFKLQ